MLRNGDALLDPPTREIGTRRDARGRSSLSPDHVAFYHRLGGRLLREAGLSGRREAATAAVEVFRDATEFAPNDPSLCNGYGASLVALARLQSHADSVSALTRAVGAFEVASDKAKRQTAPRAAWIRYAINLAMALWMRGERTGDSDGTARAVDILQSVAIELSPSSAYWSHVQDNLGNALMVLGRIADAIKAYEAALRGRQLAAERARALNNLGTAHAEGGRHAQALKCFREALALQKRDQIPLAWALTEHNLANALLQDALSRQRSARLGKQLRASIDASRAALEVRSRARTPFDWAITTASMANAELSLGTYLCTARAPPDRRNGIDRIRSSISLYKEALVELSTADFKKTLRNLQIALQVLAGCCGNEASISEVEAHRLDILQLAERCGFDDLVQEFGVHRQQRSATGDNKNPNLPATLPFGLRWPAETYSEAHKKRRENVVEYLRRVWLPLIRAGLVDLRTLRERDPSAAKGVDNFRQQRDPRTGQRRELPPDLHIPTKKEINDRLAQTISAPGDRPARLDWALRARSRRDKMKETHSGSGATSL
jgi:tetratricopeptide (TPR) repeat protein